MHSMDLSIRGCTYASKEILLTFWSSGEDAASGGASDAAVKTKKEPQTDGARNSNTKKPCL